jgi:hypothetical protein
MKNNPDVHPGSRSFSIPDPGSRGQKRTGSRIRIRNTPPTPVKTLVRQQTKVTDLDLHYFWKLVPHPDPYYSENLAPDTNPQ